MDKLLTSISGCTLCQEFLDLGPRPVMAAHPDSRIVIIGQAPGIVVHRSGVPWEDRSGDNLRKWMGIDPVTFYDPCQIALLPMGFCYPGKGKSGDLPPRKECAPFWHDKVLAKISDVRLTLLIGKYAQDYYLKNKEKLSLTETVKRYQAYLPDFFVLPHPSPRNNRWMAKNPWFKSIVLPELQNQVRNILK